NFTLIEDTVLSETKRWVIVSPKGFGGCCLLLAKAANDEQKSRVGNQTGGRVFLFLYTDNFWRDYNTMLTNGIQFARPPAEEVIELLRCLKISTATYGISSNQRK
ncbi:MAG TPA: hypothetical protein VH396_09750, partial [Chitinophagaceae bacterium]